MATRPEDLSPEYRAIYESFRGLGMSEREAMTAATLRPATAPGYDAGGHVIRPLAESAEMFADDGAGHVVEAAFAGLGASMIGRDGGTVEGERRAFAESVGRHPSGAPAGEGIPPRVVEMLDESARRFFESLDDAGRGHVEAMFEHQRSRLLPPLQRDDHDRAVLERHLAAEAGRQAGRRLVVGETRGRVTISEVTGR